MNDINFNISLVLTHTILYEQKELYPPEYCASILAGGDPPAASPQESTGQMIASLTSGLPGLLNVIKQQALPYELSNFGTSAATSPLYTGLQTELYRDFGPQLNEIGQGIARTNALNQVETDRQIVGSDAAKNLVSGVDTLQRSVDPEFYANRSLTSSKYGDLLGGMDPNALSGAERANVERNVNRSNIGRGTADSGSNIGAIGNALTFDDRLQAKRSALSQALQNFGQIQGGSKSGVDAFTLTTGKPSSTSFGQGNFLGVNQNAQANTAGQSNALLGQIGENTRTGMNIDAQRRDALDRVNETLNSTLGNL